MIERTDLNQTPAGGRTHIAFFGKRNSGKSSLINALTGQQTSIVSAVAGTTTDPVKKAMEIHGLGAVMLIDTPGFDDVGGLGLQRVEKTRDALSLADIAVFVFADAEIDSAKEWVKSAEEKKTPCVFVLNKIDLEGTLPLAAEIERVFGAKPVLTSATSNKGLGALLTELQKSLPDDIERTITGDLVRRGDSVLLVMPQDLQAPKGRLILPQVQTIRELLDKGCLVHAVQADEVDAMLSLLKTPPVLIITDSQLFREVYAKKPVESKLTSFSVLFAGLKGDLRYFAESAAAIEHLTAESHVLIAEACTHAPLSEDIGRVKIPRMLRKRVGEELKIDIVSGADFPQDLGAYDLIIHCGACMFNRKHVMTRVEAAKKAGVPMSNYGIVIAYLQGILQDVSVSE